MKKQGKLRKDWECLKSCRRVSRMLCCEAETDRNFRLREMKPGAVFITKATTDFSETLLHTLAGTGKDLRSNNKWFQQGFP